MGGSEGRRSERKRLIICILHKEKIERYKKKRPSKLLEGFIIKTKYFPFYYLLSVDYAVLNSVTKTIFSNRKNLVTDVYQMEYYYFSYGLVHKEKNLRVFMYFTRIKYLLFTYHVY